MLIVDGPAALGVEPFASGRIRQRPDDGQWFALPLDVDTQHTESGLGTVKRDTLDGAGQMIEGLLWHGGHHISICQRDSSKSEIIWCRAYYTIETVPAAAQRQPGETLSADLAAVVAAWPNLPAAVKAGIMATVQALAANA